MAGKRDIEAGRAFVRLFMKDDMSTALQKAMQNVGSSLQSAGQQIAKVGAGAMAAGAGILAPFAASIKSASDMEETMNKFNVVFGENAAAMKAWGDETAAQLGRSKKQMADFLGNTQDLLVPLGFEPGAATEFSKQISTLAIDLASFNNMQDADVLRDLHAALTGSGEVMKKYGVVVSEAAVKQELLNQGMDANAATEQQKAMARLNIIMRGTTAAHGDALRSAGGFANQMKSLLSSIEDVRTEIGSALLPVVTPLIGRLKEALTSAVEWVSENKGLVVGIAAFGAGLVAAGAAITGVGVAIAGAGAGIAALGTVLGAVLSPVGLVSAALVGGVAAWLRYSDTGQEAIASLKQVFSGMLETAKTTFGGIADALSAGDISLAGKIAWLGLQTAFSQGSDIVLGMWERFTGELHATWIGMNSLITNALLGTAGFITRTIDRIIETINRLPGVDIGTIGFDSAGAVRTADEDAARALAARKRQQEQNRAARQAAIASIRAELDAARATAATKVEANQQPGESKSSKAGDLVAQGVGLVQSAIGDLRQGLTNAPAKVQEFAEKFREKFGPSSDAAPAFAMGSESSMRPFSLGVTTSAAAAEASGFNGGSPMLRSLSNLRKDNADQLAELKAIAKGVGDFVAGMIYG